MTRPAVLPLLLALLAALVAAASVRSEKLAVHADEQAAVPETAADHSSRAVAAPSAAGADSSSESGAQIAAARSSFNTIGVNVARLTLFSAPLGAVFLGRRFRLSPALARSVAVSVPRERPG